MTSGETPTVRDNDKPTDPSELVELPSLNPLPEGLEGDPREDEEEVEVGKVVVRNIVEEVMRNEMQALREDFKDAFENAVNRILKSNQEFVQKIAELEAARAKDAEERELMRKDIDKLIERLDTIEAARA